MSAVLRPTLRSDQIAVGDVLPELPIELTPTLIVSSAIATRDYQDVHHDRDLAQQKGSKDIFMNILSSTGFVERYVTDWAGPEALVRRIDIRLGAPNYPYDTMVLQGSVRRVEPTPAGANVEVDVTGRNGLGDHVVGTVTIEVPSPAVSA
jgi:molybdopterin-binding protein